MQDNMKPFAWPADPAKLARVSIVACGTAYMAGLTAKYSIERFARLPVEIDVASEYRYREAPVDDGGLTIVVSQSGETADTLASLRYVKERGSKTIGVVNVPFERRTNSPTRSRRRSPARRSASPRPRPSPASSRRWPRSRSAWARRAGRSTRPRSGH